MASKIAYVEFYVADLDAATRELVDGYAFSVAATAGGDAAGFHSVALRQGDITLVLTEGEVASAYVSSHGDGVADIAISVPDAAAAFATATEGGARPIRRPTAMEDGCVTATVSGFGDVVHTLVQPAGDDPLPPGFTPVAASGAADAALRTIDHIAVCLDPRTLDDTVALYGRSLGLREIFAERIEVGEQAMKSKVMQSESGRITFTLIEPDDEAAPGQIDDFLKNHHGPGVQHLAYETANAVDAVRVLGGRGVGFLTTPRRYYDLLAERIQLDGHTLDDLRETNLLADVDHGGQLFQIFTTSTHVRRTLFFELIERRGARTFGTANIRALYEAVEQDRIAGGEVAR